MLCRKRIALSMASRADAALQRSAGIDALPEVNPVAVVKPGVCW
jgi:hypothetical protein